MVRQAKPCAECAFITFQLLYEILQIRFISMHWNTFANFAAESCSNICAHGRPVRWLLYGGRCKISSTVQWQCNAVQCSAGPSYAVITWQTNRPTDCKDCQQCSNTTVCKCACMSVCVYVCVRLTVASVGADTEPNWTDRTGDRQWLDMPKLSLLVWQFIKKHVPKFYIVFAISLIQNLFEERLSRRKSEKDAGRKGR